MTYAKWNCAEGRWFPGTVALEGGPGICDITFFPSSYIFVVTSLDNIARVWTVLQRFVDEVESERKQMKDALRQTAATRIQTKVRLKHLTHKYVWPQLYLTARQLI